MSSGSFTIVRRGVDRKMHSHNDLRVPLGGCEALPARVGQMLAVLLLFLSVGCSLGEVTAAEGDDLLVVEAYLQASAGEEQRILLHRTMQDGITRPEPGALVIVTGPDGSVRFRETTLRNCALLPNSGPLETESVEATCYVADVAAGLIVVPGATYELEVTTTSGERVRGRTTVPGDFYGRNPNLPPVEPFPTCYLPPRTNLELIWTPSEGAWGYLGVVSVNGLATALQGMGFEIPNRLDLTGVAISSSDTTMVLPADFGLFELGTAEPDLLVYLQEGFPPRVSAHLRVNAIDRNYMNAIRGGNFNPSGSVRTSSVVGDGVGVFASYVPRELFIFVDRESALPRC